MRAGSGARAGLLHREQCSPYIDVEQLVEMLLGDTSQGSKFSNPGVGENDFDSPLRLDGLIEPVKVGQFGNVALNAGNVAADCRDTCGSADLANAVREELAPEAPQLKVFEARVSYRRAGHRRRRNKLRHTFATTL